MTELEPARTYSNPTATDILRRMLDERGVEHYDHENGEPLRDLSEAGPDPATSWRMGDASVCAVPNNKGTFDIWIDHATPAQAIAATLGSCNRSNNCTNGERTETCKLDDFADVPFSVDYEIEGYDMDSGRDYAALAECSACGAYIIVPPEYHHVLTCDGDEVYQPYRYCPNCGAKVVDPTTNDVDAEVAQ